MGKKIYMLFIVLFFISVLFSTNTAMAAIDTESNTGKYWISGTELWCMPLFPVSDVQDNLDDNGNYYFDLYGDFDYGEEYMFQIGIPFNHGVTGEKYYRFQMLSRPNEKPGVVNPDESFHTSYRHFSDYERMEITAYNLWIDNRVREAQLHIKVKIRNYDNNDEVEELFTIFTTTNNGKDWDEATKCGIRFKNVKSKGSSEEVDNNELDKDFNRDGVVNGKDLLVKSIFDKYEELNGDLSGVSDETIISWAKAVAPILDNLRMDAEGKQEQKIAREIVNKAKKVIEEIYNSINGGLSQIDRDTLEDWYTILKSEKGLNEMATAICNEYESIEEDVYNFHDIEDESDLEFWKPGASGSNNELKNKAGIILGGVQIFGSVFSAIAIVVIGIKYMLGSAEEKAKYKETMIPYIIGCVMLFGITNIAGVLYKFGISLSNL